LKLLKAFWISFYKDAVNLPLTFKDAFKSLIFSSDVLKLSSKTIESTFSITRLISIISNKTLDEASFSSEKPLVDYTVIEANPFALVVILIIDDSTAIKDYTYCSSIKPLCIPVSSTVFPFLDYLVLADNPSTDLLVCKASI
jgi:hypothetical protein